MGLLSLDSPQRQAHQDGCGQEEKRTVGKGVDTLERLCTAGGRVNWHGHCAKQCGGSLKLKHKITL